jgi:hypothetical protein
MHRLLKAPGGEVGAWADLDAFQWASAPGTAALPDAGRVIWVAFWRVVIADAWLRHLADPEGFRALADELNFSPLRSTRVGRAGN